MVSQVYMVDKECHLYRLFTRFIAQSKQSIAHYLTIFVCAIVVFGQYGLVSIQKAQAQGVVIHPLETIINEDDQDPGFPRASEPDHPSSQVHIANETININMATAEELSAFLPGIGPSKASRIVQWRLNNGPFQSIDQLLLVNGIGTVTYANISHLVRVNDSVGAFQPRKTPHQAEARARRAVKRLVMRAEHDAICYTRAEAALQRC